MIQSGDKYAHATTAELCCRDMCLIGTWLDHKNPNERKIIWNKILITG